MVPVLHANPLAPKLRMSHNFYDVIDESRAVGLQTYIMRPLLGNPPLTPAPAAVRSPPANSRYSLKISPV
jgi:hypothetical protein